MNYIYISCNTILMHNLTSTYFKFVTVAVYTKTILFIGFYMGLMALERKRASKK